jgi:phosphocarrier protein HPr
MIEKRLKIQNELGLHARPASLFVKTAAKFKADVYISKDDQEVNGKSIMGVMMLAAEMGSEILLRIDGEDEKEALAALTELLNRKFDEE